MDETAWNLPLRDAIQNTFGDGGNENPEGLAKRLSSVVNLPRNEWPSSLLRRMWEALMEVEPGRRRSAVHEARWLNLLGFSLRPGYGLALDDWRVSETLRVLRGKLVHAASMCRMEWWILLRRIAGGMEGVAAAGPGRARWWFRAPRTAPPNHDGQSTRPTFR